MIECPHCGGGAKKAKSFTWGNVLGVLSFVIPQQIVFYLHQNNVMALLIGLLHVIVLFGLVYLYRYLNSTLN